MPDKIDLTPKRLNQEHIRQANYHSMGGTRGDVSEHEYHVYAAKILGWKISDEKKRKLLDKLYEKWSEMLSHEARHVSVAVAGPANYDPKKFDHSDKIMSLSSEIVEWFNGLEKQIEESSREVDDVRRLADLVDFCAERDERPDDFLSELAPLAPDKFAELFEKYQPKYKWRKNGSLCKLYEAAKSGTLAAKKRETFFENADFTAYRFGDRAYIKFAMRPQRQLIVALKSRGWWWNSGEGAWSTYLGKVDEEWVKSISERYARYV